MPAPDLSNLWKGPQQVDNYLASHPEFQPLADQPQAKWVNNDYDADQIPNWKAAAAGKTLLLCIYAIPGRDNGLYSAGGFPDRASYLAFVTKVRDNLGDYPAIISYEPDALGHTPSMSAEVKAERIETLRQGVNILSGILNAEVYIDASQWVATADQANLLQSVDVHLIEGFTLNTSGYDAQSSCYSYGNALVTALGGKGITGKRYIVDSSRNGVGPLTDADRPLADPWLDTSQAWCNPPKRRTGLVPGPGPTDQPNCRANLWIKNPGESDGSFPSLSQSTYYGENAPSAGAFWVPFARDLLGLTPQGGSVTSPTGTGTISDVAATFDADWGSFTVRSGGPTLVGGRARIPVVSGGIYENIDTARTFKLQGGSVFARVYPPAASGAATEASILLAVNSPTAGDRATVFINAVGNVIRFGLEAGYYDPASVTLTYDATAMAYVRIRETGGSVYWDTSPDGTTWTQRKTVASPAWATATTSGVQFVANRDSGTANYAEVDNVNRVPSTGVSGTSALTGSGTLAFSGARPTHRGSPAMTGSGALSFSVARISTGSALALTGSGSAATSASGSASSSIGLGGSGTLTVTLTRVTTSQTMALTGSGAASLTGKPGWAGPPLALGGSGSLDLSNGVASRGGTVALNGSGGLGLTDDRSAHGGSLVLGAVGSLDVRTPVYYIALVPIFFGDGAGFVRAYNPGDRIPEGVVSVHGFDGLYYERK